MKKIIFLLLLIAVMIIPSSVMPTGIDMAAWTREHIDLEPGTAILPGWAMPESMKPTPKSTYPPGSNTGTIESLTKLMKYNIETSSVEGLTGENTFIDAADKIGECNISTAVISYYCELLEFPAVAKCQFSPGEEGALSLKGMTLYIYPKETGESKEKQVQELVYKFDAMLGTRITETAADYGWGSGTNYVFLNASLKGILPPRAIAQVIALSGDSDMPDIFPCKFGTDIHDVYNSYTPGFMPEDFNDPYLYYMCYYEADNYINLKFKVKGSEIKICTAEYEVRLLNTGFEDMEVCFESFGDSMEEILGPAVARDGSPSERLSFMKNPPEKIYQPALKISWHGLEIVASYDTGAPCIYVRFTEEYFTS